MATEQALRALRAELRQLLGLVNTEADAAHAAERAGDLLMLLSRVDNGEVDLVSLRVEGRSLSLSQRMHAAMAILRRPSDPEAPILLICPEPTRESTTLFGQHNARDWLEANFPALDDLSKRELYDGMGVVALSWGRLPAPPASPESSDIETRGPSAAATVSRLLATTLAQFPRQRFALCVQHSPQELVAADHSSVLQRAVSMLGQRDTQNLHIVVHQMRHARQGLPPQRRTWSDLPADISQLGLAEFVFSPSPGAQLNEAVARNLALRSMTTGRIAELTPGDARSWPTDLRLDSNLLAACGLIEDDSPGGALISPGIVSANRVLVAAVEYDADGSAARAAAAARIAADPDGEASPGLITVALPKPTLESENFERKIADVCHRLRPINPNAEWFMARVWTADVVSRSSLQTVPIPARGDEIPSERRVRWVRNRLVARRGLSAFVPPPGSGRWPRGPTPPTPN